MSDALCRIASGGSFAVRQLYTDQDEILLQAARPVILNGIEGVITRPDLANRAVFLRLPHVHEGRRRPEKQVWQDFEAATPLILGALLDAASHGMRRLPEVRLDHLPRMADFVLWSTACERIFCSAGGFQQAYEANRRSAIEDVIEADPVAGCVRELMNKQTVWIGTASDLLRTGAEFWSQGGWRRCSDCPRSARALAGRLRRAQAPLRVLGIEISFSRTGRLGTRTIRLNKSGNAPTERPSAPSVASALNGRRGCNSERIE